MQNEAFNLPTHRIKKGVSETRAGPSHVRTRHGYEPALHLGENKVLPKIMCYTVSILRTTLISDTTHIFINVRTPVLMVHSSHWGSLTFKLMFDSNNFYTEGV